MNVFKMKNAICVMIAMLSSNVFSQDVIITKTGEQIRAKITAVTEDNVSYKKHHDQQGATFTLGKDKIKIISWENGDIDDFEKTIPAAEPTKNVGGEAKVVNSGEILPFINRQGQTFHLSNGTIYSKDQLRGFLMEENLSHIWMKYERGCNLLRTGWVLIGVGAGLEIVGMAVCMSAVVNGNLDAYLAGVWIVVVGSLMETAGIPTAIVGAVKKNRSIADYNSIYGGKSRTQQALNMTFKAGLVGNGIGLSLNF